MVLSKDEMSKWVNNRSCLPHQAACLIYGFNPDKFLEYSEFYHQYSFKENIEELDNLIEIFKPYIGVISIRENIFFFFNIALKNVLNFKETLLLDSVIAYRSNLIEEDRELFDKKYKSIQHKIKCLESGETILKTFDDYYPSFPKKMDTISEVLKNYIENFRKEHKKYPTDNELWANLKVPNKIFDIKKGNKCYVIEDQQLTRKSFDNRMDRYRKK